MCFNLTKIIGGRSYPVRHYPVAMRLRDRKGRAILCSHLLLTVGTARVLRSKCHPRHFFTQKLAYAYKKAQNMRPAVIFINHYSLSLAVLVNISSECRVR